MLTSLTPLLAMITFPGLSDEQALITALVSQNPAANERLRSRARTLLLLNDGATPAEVTHDTHTSQRSVLDLIHRFRKGGLCQALLGTRATSAGRAWLTLSPEGPPRVHLSPPLKSHKIHRRHGVDSATLSANQRPS